MITEEDARRIAQEQIDKINPSLEINFIYAVNAENPDDALYFCRGERSYYEQAILSR